ncbi:hypothetical protein [Vibrio parahaemolyticus]|uniref:hypothetical protein n=1 Tax=Vibrio parahaemolyticus TaxID=670 RepID=UPI002360838F|nr:hypothetical protein [Vibrio parahaemolyticus]
MFSTEQIIGARVTQIASPQTNVQENTVLQLNVKKVDAKTMLTDEGIVVLKGSQVLTPSGDRKPQPSYLAIFAALLITRKTLQVKH